MRRDGYSPERTYKGPVWKIVQADSLMQPTSKTTQYHSLTSEGLIAHDTRVSKKKLLQPATNAPPFWVGAKPGAAHISPQGIWNRSGPSEGLEIRDQRPAATDPPQGGRPLDAPGQGCRVRPDSAIHGCLPQRRHHRRVFA